MARNKVWILAPDVVARIAAGEVIERPASVVKELVENSLDAGAQTIEVELKSSGKSLIAIRDDGSGIAKEDLDKLFRRHATSKLASLEDLYDIRSLGFRGEALYSVGAVSDTLLFSRTAEEDCGWQAHVRANERIALGPCSQPAGTRLEVRELFFNTPARRKFLKSNAAELNAVIDIFLPYCLLYPAKRFSLTNDGKSFLELRPAINFCSRVSAALNLDSGNLLEETTEHGQIRIHLVLGDSNIQRPRKDMQFVFINSRPVESRSISFHLNEVYRLLFPPRAYPFFCAYVEMPAGELDVNVHPAKREVRIKDDLKLISILRQFCERLLMTRGKARQASLAFNVPEAGDGGGGQVIAETAPRYQNSLEPALSLFRTETAGREDLREKLRQARYLGNLLKRYLLFETEAALLVIDQHAAQERITFERLKKQLEDGRVEIQALLTPVTFALSPQELVLWEEEKETLKKTGFETSLFDRETLAVHAHPALIVDVERSVRNLLAGEKISRLGHEQLARLACRSSVMFGFAMNPEQAEFQRKSLLACAAPFTCPHGRPTVIEIKEENLRRQFLR